VSLYRRSTARENESHEEARKRIQHVIVLMLENRSFDHLLGFVMPGQEPTGPNNPLHLDRPSPTFPPTADGDYSLPVDPPHGHLSVAKQINTLSDPKMNGFVAAYLEKASRREPIPTVHWSRVRVLVVVLMAGLASLVRLTDGRVVRSWLLAGALIAVAIVVALRMRRYQALSRKIAIWGAMAGILLGLFSDFFGGSWPGPLTLAAGGVGFGLGYIQARSKVLPYIAPESAREAIAIAPYVMRSLHPDKIPVIRDLARAFVVCERWHCSVPGATWPNRNFAHAATSEGTTDIEIGWYKSKTIFQRLQESKGTWRIYYDGMAQSMAFRWLWNVSPSWRELSRLCHDIEQGDLPDYTFIEPAHTGELSSSQHPGNNIRAGEGRIYDFQRGEALIAQIYEALRRTPAVFERTLFVITYDEHGGLFDHVPPPAGRDVPAPTRRKAAVSLSRELIEWFVTYHRARFGFRSLGPRVPALLISPWVDPSRDPTLYEHSSIVRTVRELFVPGAKRLTRRDEWALPFHHVVLQRATPRTGDSLPDLSDRVVPIAAEPATWQLLGLASPPEEQREVIADPEDHAVQLGELREMLKEELQARGFVDPSVPPTVTPVERTTQQDPVLAAFQAFCDTKVDDIR
jgi:hypothetical protein